MATSSAKLRGSDVSTPSRRNSGDPVSLNKETKWLAWQMPEE
jgi:hypothetical protein